MNLTRVFLDTEFTTLNQGTSKLISVGMICGDREFYVEVDGWKDRDCSDFTRAEVAPQLHGYQHPLDELGTRMYEYLKRQGKVVIATDSLNWDWMWLTRYLPSFPSNVDTSPLLLTRNYLKNHELYEKLLAEQFDVWKQHHALNDARAMQYAWEHSGGDIYVPSQPT